MKKKSCMGICFAMKSVANIVLDTFLGAYRMVTTERGQDANMRARATRKGPGIPGDLVSKQKSWYSMEFK